MNLIGGHPFDARKQPSGSVVQIPPRLQIQPCNDVIRSEVVLTPGPDDDGKSASRLITSFSADC